MAKEVNLQVFRKTTKHYLLQFKESGMAKNITGWTIYLTIKEKITDVDESAKVKHTISSHQDAVAGKSLITLSQEDTDRTGSYHYDITYKDTEGNVGVLYYGRIRFKQKTTQRA